MLITWIGAVFVFIPFIILAFLILFSGKTVY
jgi:hypothetical protein